MTTIIIGGSGMLLEATKAISKEVNQAILCSRDERKYHDILSNNSNARFLEFDFSKENDFKKLEDDINKNKIEVENIIIWIHSGYYKYFYSLLENIKTSKTLSIYLCQGSSANPLDEEIINKHNIHLIKLGFNTMENRWLTHEEISNGLIEAFRNKKSMNIGHI
ncbi:hypothetical protein [Mammaliicoccus sp. Dog046]|uniref:hypothetical protein n=1 Tax=Mammaliicoccus sp. Dog046 TaxID=3034233 RepID=UPI002B257115|nr:hypothetical protein [Mammaliicoccus sp. Dog046]WQK85550.1 hypothetical protein P3U32_00545 [Mammaliicoccus sp. Dog046]